MELELWQIVLVGLVASVLVQALKLVFAKFGQVLSRAGVAWVCAGVSLGLAVAFKWSDLPAFAGDPMAVITALVSYLSLIAGFATLIYNILLSKILQGLGWTVQRVLAARR